MYFKARHFYSFQLLFHTWQVYSTENIDVEENEEIPHTELEFLTFFDEILRVTGTIDSQGEDFFTQKVCRKKNI